MAGLLDMADDGGDPPLDLTTLINDAAPAPAADATPAPAPDAAPPTPAPADDKPNILARFGLALAGGDPGLTPLTKEQKESVGTRALMQFGLNLLANSGPSYQRHTAAQIIGSGLQAAGASATEQEGLFANQAAAKAGLDLKAKDLLIKQALAGGKLDLWKAMIAKMPVEMQIRLGELNVKQQEALIKSGEFGLTLEKFRESQRQAREGGNLFSGNGAVGEDPGTPVTADQALRIPAIAALPPDARTAAVTAVTEAGMGANEAQWWAGLIGPESGGQHTDASGNVTTSVKGARGFGQVLPGTFDEMAQKYGIKGTVDDLAANARASARYFHEGVIDPQYPGRLNATIRYNAGPANLEKFHQTGELPDETKKYLLSTGALNIPRPSARPLTSAPAGSAPAGGGGAGAPVQIPPAPGSTAPPMQPAVAPDTGTRQTRTPGTPAAGPGSAGPPTPEDFADLPPMMKEGFRRQLASAAGGGPDAMANAWKDINDQIAKWHALPRFTTMDQNEARRRFGSAFDPTAIYEQNQLGETRVVQQPQAPVNPTDTPAGRKAQITLDMSKKTLEQYQTTAQNARGTLASLSAMSSLTDKFGADPIGEQYPLVNKALGALPGGGTPEQRARMTASQAFDGLVSLVSTQLREIGTGRLSNQEMDRFLHALPSIGDTQEGRRLKIGILTAIVNRQVQENAIAQSHFNRPGGQGDLNGLDDELEKLGPVIPQAPPAPTPSMSADERAAAIQARAAFAARLRPGMLYNDENGHYTTRRGG